MKMFPLLLCLTFLFAQAPYAVAEQEFSVASESLPALPPDTESSTVLARLKQQAVREYLQKTLGPRFERYDAGITADFAERYILDYQVVRQSSDSTQMEISGRLDTVALKQWIRRNEIKATGSTSLKPVFLMSANLPGYSLDPRQTAAMVKQTGSAPQTFYKNTSDAFQKFNAALSVTEETGLGLVRPPVQENEIRALRSFGLMAGFNSAVWVNLSPCPGCGTRVEIVLYNLTQARQVLSVSAEVEMSPSEMGDSKRLIKALSKAFQDFNSAFEESVATGTLFASEYLLAVENLTSYKAFKLVDAALNKQDFILRAVVSKTQNKVATFRILSPLPPRELYQRFQVTQFSGLTLKTVGIDSQAITMRYLN